MLEAMKRGAQTWVAKILFSLLVFSFAIWGIADVFTGFNRGSVAKVGSVEISADDLQRSFQSEIDQFSQNANRRITPDQARAIGLDRRVLNQLIGGAAIEAHADDLGLSLSDATLVKSVQTDPNFQIDGTFSREGFDNLLRQLNLSEKGFLELRRKDELRAQLLGAMIKAQTVPEPMIEAQHRYAEEHRKIEWVTIDADKAVSVDAPDDAKIKSLYETNKADYMTPEFRKFEVLSLDVAAMKSLVSVTDQEIATAYGETKDTYDTPEQRRIQQLAFKDKATADAARKALVDGTKTFADVAKDIGAKTTDVDLGSLSRKQLIDPIIADAAFALAKDAYSDVIEGRFTTVILRVTQIEPGVKRTLDQVKGEVRDKIAERKARIEVPLKFDEVEDLRSAGKTLKEVAAALKLPFKEVAASDRKGLTPDGKPALETPNLPKIISRVFQPEVGGEDNLITLDDGGHAWINRLETIAPTEIAFDKVKDEVKDKYLKSERDKKLAKLASELAKRLNEGANTAAIEAEAKSKFETTDAITRIKVPQGLSADAVAQAFKLAKGKAAHAVSSNNSSQTVFRTVDIIPAAAISEEQRKALTARLEAELANQTLTEYTESLKAELGTSINDTEFRRALGVTE